MGIGILYGKKELLQEMPPFQGGGDMIDKVSFDGTTFAPPPEKIRGRTPNVTDAIGLAEAFRYMARTDLDSVFHHEGQLLERARGLQEIKGFVEHGTTAGKAAVLSFPLTAFTLMTWPLSWTEKALPSARPSLLPATWQKLGVDATAELPSQCTIPWRVGSLCRGRP